MNEDHPQDCENLVCRARVFPLLYEISRTITDLENLKEATGLLLKIMSEHLGVVRGMFTLYHRRTGTIFIHESLGLTKEEEARGIYHPGEGITGRVVETGESMIVPQIRREPNFLGKIRAVDEERANCSFLCIPIRRGKKVLGTISVEKPYTSERGLKKDTELLELVASIMAQAVELYLLENEDKVYWEKENIRLQEALKERHHPANLIGNSLPMRESYSMIGKIASAKISVLVLGESGVGKELVAEAIHQQSPYSTGPFVKFNCAALPESIIESELFGHEKGSFTGAGAQRKGRFEEADGGSIFLDEVGELPLATQAKLLRVLQEKTFERVGGNLPIRVDIRVIAATNRDLPRMVAEGTFREDLYYRLNAFPITIPPLRERGGDVIALSDHFVCKACRDTGKVVKRISTPALQMLMAYHWPGNVRELENVINRAVILCEDEVIHGYNLPPAVQESVSPGSISARSGLETKIETIEYEYLIEALKKTCGNMSEAARHLGMTRRMLGLRLKKHSIEYKKFRNRKKNGDVKDTLVVESLINDE